MNIIKTSISLIISAIFYVEVAMAQVPPSAQYADPGIVEILNQGGGNVFAQSTDLIFNIFNSSNGVPGTGIVPANSINVQIGFPVQYGIQNGTTAQLTTLLAGQGWAITYIETGASGTITITNTQSIAEFAALPITIPVIGFAMGTGLTIATVDRNLPIQTNNVNVGNDVTNAPFTVSQPLPVTLLSFTATKVEKTSLLQWVTSSENNSKGFVIERSDDGKNWNKIGFVSSKAENGNSKTVLTYEFVDTKPLKNENFYRLKQIAFDGEFEYSRVLVLNFKIATNIRLLPNPVHNLLIIEGLDSKTKIGITNSIGQVVLVLNTRPGSPCNIDISHFANGVYYVNITDENGDSRSYKVVKQ